MQTNFILIAMTKLCQKHYNWWWSKLVDCNLVYFHSINTKIYVSSSSLPVKLDKWDNN